MPPNLCYLILPTADEAAAWAPRNDMALDRFWACVLRQYEAVATAFADPAADVLAVVCPDQTRLPGMLSRLRAFGTVVCMRHPGASPATQPRTKLVVWHHTPLLQRCEIVARVHLESIMACPRLTRSSSSG